MRTHLKSSVMYILIALVPILIYDWISLAFFTGAYMTLPEEMLENHYFMIDSLFCAVALILFSTWLYQINRRRQDTELNARNRCKIHEILILVFGVGGISTIWFILVETVLQSVSFITDSLESFDETWSSVDTESYLWVFLSVVLLGPLVEEFMFRGVIFHYLEKIKAGWFPILVSGILFGLWHQEPVQVVYTAIMGVVLGILYAYTRDLKAPIAIHILNNFLSALPSFLDTPLTQNLIFYLSFLMIPPTILILIRMVKQLKTISQIHERRDPLSL